MTVLEAGRGQTADRQVDAWAWTYNAREESLGLATLGIGHLLRRVVSNDRFDRRA